MLDVIYVLVQIVLFVGSIYALRLLLMGQGKFTGRND
jgi:hypothetical protein